MDLHFGFLSNTHGTINSLSFINENIKKIIENVNFCVE